MQQLDDLMHRAMRKQTALGLAVAIVQQGDISYTNGFGITSVGASGVPVTPTTLFAYGSICKTLCATLIMRLVERNVLDLDIPVVQYLRGLHFSNAEYGKHITLRHLLSHTSGLPAGGKNWGPRDPDSLRRFVYEQIPLYTFLAEPGAVHLYSNTVFCISGPVAEAVTGRSYADLLHAYVLDPIGMDRVTFDPVVAMTHAVALPHHHDDAGQLAVQPRLTYNVSGNPSSFGYGSVSDLACLARMYVNYGRVGKQPFLTSASIAEMQRPHTRLHLDSAAHPFSHMNRAYGLGLSIGTYRGHRVARHGGMDLSANGFFDLFPDDQAAVIVLTNYANEALLIELVAELYDVTLNLPYHGLRVLDAPPPVGQPRHEDLARCTGTYLCIETADIVRFVVHGDDLIMERNAAYTPLVFVSPDRFYAAVSERSRQPIAFMRRADATVTHVMIAGQPYHPCAIDAQPDTTGWNAYEGVYKDPSNANPEEILVVHHDGDTVTMRTGSRQIRCTAVNNRCFVTDIGVIEFGATERENTHVVICGKATRYYPIDAQAFNEHQRISYLVDIPLAPQRP